MDSTYNRRDLEAQGSSELVSEADTSVLTKAKTPNPEDISRDNDKNYTTRELEDGSLEVIYDEEPIRDNIEAFNDIGDDDNLVYQLNEEDLERIGQETIERYETDLESRLEWNEIVEAGMKMLGLTDSSDEELFDGSATVYHPLIIEQAVDFQSKAITELFPAKGPVKTQILGQTSEELEQKATRVRNHMNYQVQHQMTEYFDEKERMLFYLPNVGSAFTKTYYNMARKRPCTEFLTCDDFVVNYYAKSLEDAYCYTHKIIRNTNDITRDQINGLYRDDINIKDLGVSEDVNSPLQAIKEFNDETLGTEAPQSSSLLNNSGVHTILEQHVFLDLPEPFNHPDGLELPYIVHVHKESGKVLAIYKNWETGDENYNKIVWFTHYKYVPGTGFYGLGNFHLLGGLCKSLTLTIRSLLDAGMFSNAQIGFKDKKARIVNPNEPHSPGTWKDVEGPIQDLSNAFFLLPSKEPSNTLFMLYDNMNQTAKRFADKADQIIADSSNTGPVGTTIALLEASMKFFSAIHKRLHHSQKQEFGLIARINKTFLLDDTETELLIPNSTLKITRADYDNRIDILPVSDPNMPSNSHRVVMAQTKLQAGQQSPHLHNMREVYREFYNALGEHDTEHYLPYEEEPQMLSPFEDIKAAMDGKPIKAFKGQDHKAHAGVKQAWMQSPEGGMSPLFQTITPVIAANIREHMFMDYVEMVEGQVPNPEDEAAKAMVAQQVTQFQQQQAEQAQQGGVDPAKQMLAQAELMNAQSRQQEVQHKVQKEQAELGLDIQELAIKEGEVAAKIAQTDTKINLERVKMGADMVKEALKNQPSLQKNLTKTQE